VNTKWSTLLVEDHDALADSLIGALEDEGYAVERARTWQEGLEAFRVGAHELIIADYNLPGSDHGLLLLLQVKQLMPSTRLVLISGALSPQAERALEPLGLIDAYIRKDSILATRLLPFVKTASEAASQTTDWQRVAKGALADPAAQREQVRQIDAILRADLTRE
jgi:CheY-like chemotaxis protein